MGGPGRLLLKIMDSIRKRLEFVDLTFEVKMLCFYIFGKSFAFM